MVSLQGFSRAPEGCAKEILSPLSYYLVMETLSRLVNKVIDAGFLEDFRFTNGQLESMLISNLLCG